MQDTALTQSRILIVDDNAGNVDQLEQLLEFNDFTGFKSTTDPRQVEPLVEEFDPDIILLDLQMPHLDGFQVLEVLRNRIPEDVFLPVIVLTADVTPESRERALKLGAMDFLTKPFDFLEVILRINNLLRARHFHRQLRGYSDQLESAVKERTAELKQAQDELVAQERYKAMGQMASGIAHDFNNVISIVMGYTELLTQVPDILKDADETQKTLKTIHTAAQDATSIIRRLRDFYKSDKQEEEFIKTSDLREAAEDAVSLTQPKWKDQAQAEGRQIEVITELESVEVAITASKLREILTNLIFNAVDAMPEGGTITLHTRPDDQFAILEVQDTGTGMTEEVRQKCLEMFFSTKGDKGTGLGLGMVHDIIHKHRGHIDVTSQPGEGSTFTVRLPRATESIGTESDDTLSTTRPLDILLVEDEAIVRKVIENTLGREGHTVVSAADGQQGLVSFLAGSFDLVITDLAMPIVNGKQLIEAIRRHNPEIPIILYTGFGDQLVDENSVPEGINRLLKKPASAETLYATIAELFPS